MKKSAFVMKEMIRYFEGDIKRINHLIKVFGFAKTLGELERIDSYTQEIIEIAALTHDIGIGPICYQINKKTKKNFYVMNVVSLDVMTEKHAMKMQNAINGIVNWHFIYPLNQCTYNMKISKKVV